jgi:hypothetical protein
MSVGQPEGDEDESLVLQLGDAADGGVQSSKPWSEA